MQIILLNAILDKNIESSLLVAAKEGMQVYHMVRHNHSFDSMKCTSKIMRSVYGEKQFACSSTKAAAIVTGVFEPMIRTQIQIELKEAEFTCISTDASNHKEIKMYPVIFRYFLPLEGIRTRLADYIDMPDETGEAIFQMLKSSWENWDIKDKIIAFCADNCPTNFGSVGRGGEKNVFFRLQSVFNDLLVGIGCLAHILHNAPQDACSNVLPFDIQSILVLMYKQFYNSTKQTEELKAFCEELSIEFSKVKGCPSVRFLAKKNCIESILKIFNALKKYFDSNPSKKVPKSLEMFLADPLHKFYLIVVRDLCELFESAIRMIEGNQTSGIEALKTVENLQAKIQNVIRSKFISIEAEEELNSVKNHPKLLKDLKITKKEQEKDSQIVKNRIFETILKPLYGKYSSPKF